MLRRQAFLFEFMPKGQETRHLRQFAGSPCLVYNTALAINTQRYSSRRKVLHKVSKDISKNHVFLVVEDLQVKNCFPVYWKCE